MTSFGRCAVSGMCACEEAVDGSDGFGFALLSGCSGIACRRHSVVRDGFMLIFVFDSEADW